MPKRIARMGRRFFDQFFSLPGLLCVVSFLFIFIFWDFVRFHYMFFFRDIGADTFSQFYPTIIHKHDLLYSELIPRWTFSIGIGQNIYPASINNPPKIIVSLLPKEMIAYALIWLEWFKYMISSLAFYKFLRIRKNRAQAAFFGALAFTFSGYMLIGCTWYGHSDIVTFMALGLLAVEMIIERKNWWLLPLVFIFLAGTRMAFFMEFAAIYVILRLIEKYRRDFSKARPTLLRLIGAGTIGILMALPFQTSTIFNIVNSPRLEATGDVGPSLSSLPIFHLAEPELYLTAIYRLFSPNMLGPANEYLGWFNWLEGPNFYCGVLMLLLLPQFFILAPKRKRRIYAILVFFWLFILTFPWFRHALYLFAGDYFKTFVSIFLPATLCLLGANSLHYFLRGKKPNLVLLLSSIVVLCLLLLIPLGTLADNLMPDNRMRALVFLLIDGSLLAALVLNQKQKWIFGLLFLSLVIELGWTGKDTLSGRRTTSKEIFEGKNWYNDYTVEALDYIESIESDDRFYRVDKLFGSAGRGFGDAIGQGFRGSKSYQSFNNRYYMKFLEDLGLLIKDRDLRYKWIFGVSKIQPMHPLLNIKYLLANHETDQDVDRDIYEFEKSFYNTNLYRNKYHLPFGTPFTTYFSQSDYQAMNFDQRQNAMSSGVVLDDQLGASLKGLRKLGAPDIPAGKAEVLAAYRVRSQNSLNASILSNNHLVGRIELKKPSALLLSIPFDPGWKIRANGERQEVLTVNSGLSAIYLEEGAYDIDMRYTPPWFWHGWISFFAGLSAYLFFLIRPPVFLRKDQV